MSPIAEPAIETVTVEGVELAVPLEVQAATSIVASYRVDPRISQEIIDDSGFAIRVGDDGLAGLSVVGVSYLQSVFGRYNEVGVVFDVESLGPEVNPTFIKWLPVTGQFSCAVGRQVWGFPKWVTDLRYTIYGEEAQVEWFEDDELVLRLRLGAGGQDIGGADLPVSSYTVGPEGPQCTQTDMRNSGMVMGAPAELEIGTSGHPAAQALRDLDVAQLEPALTTAVSHSSSSWGLARPRR
ncbi:MAG TPA: acetoacetate decarboxylase family protein [Acidimicrobiales bacterium]|nr:acetoacetate decarboxylase family protein [Acidimicrobiales bacterium]